MKGVTVSYKKEQNAGVLGDSMCRCTGVSELESCVNRLAGKIYSFCNVNS